MRRRSAALVLGSSIALIGALVAGCGQQTDARVAETTQAADQGADQAATAPAEAPAEQAPAPAFDSPFVSIDCATGEQTPAESAPEGVSAGPVTVSTGANGAPVVTVATGAAPVTTLETADITEGTGPAVVAGDTLTVDYCGVGLGSASLFDSSWARGQAATFPLDGVILGWQQGMPGMKAGGSRLLVIPGELGYGELPPEGILPNETLIFVVNLQAIN